MRAIYTENTMSATQCQPQKCFVLKIVDFTNTPIPELTHQETGEEVGAIQIKAYNYDDKLIGTYSYTKGQPELVICDVPAGWLRLEFLPTECKRPEAYPQNEPWNQFMLAADIIAYKAIGAAAPKNERPGQQCLPEEERQGWQYRRVAHGALYLPQKTEQINGKEEVTRPAQPCNINFVLDGDQEQCGKCGKNKWTKYLIELSPLLCWVPALAQAQLGATDDWDSISANNMAAMASLAYAAPDTRTDKDGKRASYKGTILCTLDNLRTQRARPYRVGGDWLDMILHEMPYDWHYHSMEFYEMEDAENNPTDSQVFMATNLDTIIVGVRGTAGTTDLVLDLKAIPWNTFSGAASPGKIHGGFASSFNFLWPKILAYCNKHQSGVNGPKRIFVAGHSLGGAVGSLVACALKSNLSGNPLTLYTYGSPRVGTRDFSAYWNTKVPHLRHVNMTDCIASVAPSGLLSVFDVLPENKFLHFGHLRQLSVFSVRQSFSYDLSDSMMSADDESFPWICDYGIDQFSGLAYRATRKYGGDNAPWGPYELDRWDGLLIAGGSKAPGLYKLIAAIPIAAWANGIVHHFMSKYRAHLQNELKQRYEYALSGMPMLSNSLSPAKLNMSDEYHRELAGYMRPVTLDEILQKHEAELHPRPLVEQELRRFCKDIQKLEAMSREAQDQEEQAQRERERRSQLERDQAERERLRLEAEMEDELLKGNPNYPEDPRNWFPVIPSF